MNGWKIAAIVFISLFILETLIFGYFLTLGLAIIEKEKQCSLNVCYGYDAFQYDDVEQVCYCYLNDKVEKLEFMK